MFQAEYFISNESLTFGNPAAKSLILTSEVITGVGLNSSD